MLSDQIAEALDAAAKDAFDIEEAEDSDGYDQAHHNGILEAKEIVLRILAEQQEFEEVLAVLTYFAPAYAYAGIVQFGVAHQRACFLLAERGNKLSRNDMDDLVAQWRSEGTGADLPASTVQPRPLTSPTDREA